VTTQWRDDLPLDIDAAARVMEAGKAVSRGRVPV
jgi:hypothetical protein